MSDIILGEGSDILEKLLEQTMDESDFQHLMIGVIHIKVHPHANGFKGDNHIGYLGLRAQKRGGWAYRSYISGRGCRCHVGSCPYRATADYLHKSGAIVSKLEE